MSQESEIVAGQSARKAGRYVEAVQAFQRAAQQAGGPSPASRLEFDALREVDISRYLIGRLVRGLGWPAERYEGFAALEPTLGQDAVTRRLDAIAGAGTADGDDDGATRAIRLADRLAQTGFVDEAMPGSAAISVQTALAERAWRRGDGAEALRHLDQASRSGIPSAEIQALRGNMAWRRGDWEEAMAAHNLSLLYLYGKSEPQQAGLQILYRGYRIFHYRAEFYAIPERYDPILEPAPSADRLLEHRVPRRMRSWLRRHLPLRVTNLLRRVVSRTPLVGEIQLDRMQHSPDLMAVMRTIDAMHQGRR